MAVPLLAHTVLSHGSVDHACSSVEKERYTAEHKQPHTARFMVHPHQAQRTAEVDLLIAKCLVLCKKEKPQD